jgi:hypothetical protein
MTPEEINDLKVEISKTISARMEEAFLGQSMSEVTANVVKSYLQGIMKDFLAKGYHPVVDLIEYNVMFEGNTMHVVMEPKKGLSNEDHARAVNFLFNQEFY